MFTVDSITNLVYGNVAGTIINCHIKFKEFNSEMPFTATNIDNEEHGQQIYSDIIDGKYGPIAPYVEPPKANT